MELVTVSSKGQIAIPKSVLRRASNLSEGTKLNIEVRGQKIVLSKEPAWKKLEGAGAGLGLIEFYAAEKKRERERGSTFASLDSWGHSRVDRRPPFRAQACG